MADLGTILINLGTTFPVATKLVYVIIAMMGCWVLLLAMIDGYKHAVGEIDGNIGSKGSLVWRCALAGAMVVAPVLLWSAAETFVAGGGKTYDIFSYSPQRGSTPYCDQFSSTVTLLFMLIGSISIAYGLNVLHARAKNDNSARAGFGGAMIWLIGGTFCFFVQDVAVIISNTIGIQIGFDNICKALGS